MIAEAPYKHIPLPAGCVRLAGSQRIVPLVELEELVRLIERRLQDMTTTHAQRWHYVDALQRYSGLLATARATAGGKGRRAGDPRL